MTKAVQKIALFPSRDIPFNKLVLSQANARHVKAGISIKQLAESIARRTLLQSLNVSAVLDAEGQKLACSKYRQVPGGIARWSFWLNKSAWQRRKLFLYALDATRRRSLSDSRLSNRVRP